MKPNLRPLAGKLTEIGPDIMKFGHKKAKLICTGNWKHNLETNPKWQASESSFYLPAKEKVTAYDAWEASKIPEERRRQQKMQSIFTTPIS